MGALRAVTTAQVNGSPLQVTGLVAKLSHGTLDCGVDLVQRAVVHRDVEAVLGHVEGKILQEKEVNQKMSQRSFVGDELTKKEAQTRT